MKARFLIAAPMSGSGKTTIARGLMALYRAKGYVVQPFKCGPDYIDTKFHETVCGRPSINLDTFMATPEHVRDLFAHYGADADICVVEGMMGLYDGYNRDRGSSSEIASVLDIPVVLVVDARSAAYSMAALLQGFFKFRENLNFAGVIFNKVGSEKHFQMLKQVCDDLGIECLGYLPKDASLEQESRYLGLDYSKEANNETLLKLLETHVDWKRIYNLTAYTSENIGFQGVNHLSTPCGLSALIARNAESFSFLYQETIDSFKQTRFFDPEYDVPDLENIDLLYLPGGYPEKHLETLTDNEACRKTIKDYAEQGGRIIAECGGMMYLCQKIVTDNGDYPMCGVLPYTITARKNDRKLSLGYRQFVLDGKEYRGHEFHYTQFYGGEWRVESGERRVERGKWRVESGEWRVESGERRVESGERIVSAVQVYNAKGEPVCTPVFRYKNVLASYTHLYPGFALNDK